MMVSIATAQTWSSSPSLNTWTSVGDNSPINCSFGEVKRYEVQARVTNLTSTSFSVQFRKMNGGTFGSGGTVVIIDNTECNTFPITGGGTVSYANGSTGATFTNATHNVAAGTSKTFYVRIKPSTTNWFITLPITISATAPCGNVNGNSSTASNLSVSGFTANWQAVSGASYYNVNVKKCSDLDYSNAISYQTSTNSTSLSLQGLDCGECYRFQVQAVCSAGAGNWSVSNPANIQLAQPTMPNSSSVTFSNISATSFIANWSAVSGAIGYRVNYTTCAGTFTLQDLPTSTNSITINSLAANTQYKIQIRAVYPNQCFSGWSPLSPCVTTLSNSCITWSGTPPTGEKLTAANYLCTNGIIQNSQNGTVNANNVIPRELLAKITYLGIYKGLTPNSPAVNFPVPFTDMQGSSSQYIDAIKTLAYLQFNDETTPFDRDLINFNPNTLIERKYVIKAFAEAFNISKSTATPSPFSDVATSNAMYGYIKRFHELGLITGNQVYTSSCTTGTCFHPDENITREDVFVLLYRVLTANNITRPTAAQLNSLTSYFVPGNYRMATMGNVPDIDQANFNHYQKTSFSIAGRGVSLDFTHTYNSFLTELPKGYFEEDDTATSQKFTPLGIGWTHTYNIYAIKTEAYTNGSYTEPAKIMFYYPDGSINVFDYATNLPVTGSIGVYDVMTRTPISGGEAITITTKNQTKYIFENKNNGKFYFIKTIKDRNNNGVKCTWNQILSGSRYRLGTVQEEFNNGNLGRSLTFSYANLGGAYLSQVTDNSIGRTIYFNVSGRNLLKYTDPKSQITNYGYDVEGYLTSNLLTEIQLPKGNKIRNTYAQRKLLSSKTFGQNGVVSSTTGVNWASNYSASGYNASSTVTDPQLKQTNYTLNTNGNPTSIIRPTGTTTLGGYGTGNNANLPTNISVNGQSSSMNYDTKGNILNVTKNGISNSFIYTAFNDIKSQTDGRGNITNYTYDGIGNLTKVDRPSPGGSININRNSFGQPTSISNPSNIVTSFGYDLNIGLTNQISLPLGISTSSTYDNASRLLSTTDANGKTSNYQYDANDNLTKSINPLGATNGTVEHSYDANDNHLSITNPKGEMQNNSYNFDDDLLKSESFGPHTKSYTYNEDGTLKSFTRGNGTFNYTYDATTGRLLNDGQTQYTYDTRGNIKTVTNTNGTLTMNYDVNDRLENYTDYYSNVVSYTYDNNNNVTKITYPGSKEVTYVYDPLNRCTKVTDWNGKMTTYTYLTDDRISKITLPNGTFTEYAYDAAGRPEGITNKRSNNTVISSYAFTMDNAGNHLSETITEPSILAGLQSISNQTVTYGNYPYNRIQSQGSTNFIHNTEGSIKNKGAEAFTYDLNDNLLTAPNSSFSYDGAGNRRAKTVSGVNTRYVLSILGMSQVLMETNSSNAVQNYYVYGPTGLLYRVKPNNTNQYYHYDFRGSTTAITNETQVVTHSYSYDPFGKVLASTEADFNPYRYVGQQGVAYESPTLTFMRARYYDPSIGRFVSEDPVFALNLYPYANNNPVNFIDPSGNISFGLSDILDLWTLESELIAIGISTYAETNGYLAKQQKLSNEAAILENSALNYRTNIEKGNRCMSNNENTYYNSLKSQAASLRAGAQSYLNESKGAYKRAKTEAANAVRDAVIDFVIGKLVSTGLERGKVMSTVKSQYEKLFVGKGLNKLDQKALIDLIEKLYSKVYDHFIK